MPSLTSKLNLCYIHVPYLLLRKCQKYSPNETVKAFDKAIVKKQSYKFEPVTVLKEVKKEMLAYRVNMTKEDCIKQYLEVSECMSERV